VLTAEVPDSRILDRYRSCGSMAYVEYSATLDSYRVRSNHCGLRVCPRCRSYHRRRTADILYRMLGDPAKHEPNTHKMITLTMRSTRAPLAVQLDNLREAFRRLRATPLWRKSVAYGYGVVEVTCNAVTHQWHPHLHILARTRYIPQQALSTAWLRASRGSYVVDIRRLPHYHRAVRYVCKYVGKPPSLDTLDDPVERLREYWRATRHRKLTIRIGKHPPAPPDPEPLQPAATDWTIIDRLRVILRAAAQREPRATYIVHCLDCTIYDAPDPPSARRMHWSELPEPP